MKSAAFAFALATVCFTTTAALAATTDDVKWINQCVNDDRGGATHEVILKYYTCMNNKMSDNETQSITQWEKSLVAERKACDREAGWSGPADRPMRPSPSGRGTKYAARPRAAPPMTDL
jgi:hypothetical protein